MAPTITETGFKAKETSGTHRGEARGAAELAGLTAPPRAGKRNRSNGQAGPGSFAIESGVCTEPDLLRPGEDASPLRGMSFPGARLPWALSRILHARQGSGTRRPETPDPSSADARLSPERVPPAFSSYGGAPALLQPPVPASGTAMVAVEGSAKLPGDGGGQRKTPWAKPALPRAGQRAETTRAARRGCRSREGNH